MKTASFIGNDLILKKRIGIVKLLEWAYREELIKTPRANKLRGPEQPRSGWAAVAAQGQLLTETVSDGTSPLVNRFGVVPDLTQHNAPHPAAIAVHDAVIALDALELGIPDAWCDDVDLRHGISGITDQEWPAAAGRSLQRVSRADGKLKEPISSLIIHAATSAKQPPHRGGEVKRRVVLQANGKPAWFIRVAVPCGLNHDGTERFAEVERDGMCPKSHRPLAGAYRKDILDPDPADFLVDRARYEVWRASLDVLCEALADLQGFIVLPSQLPWRPWLCEPAPSQRVLQGGGTAEKSNGAGRSKGAA
jgi:hypothetical protein